MLVDMYVAFVPNRGSSPAVLLREGYREDGKVKTRTLANLSHLPPSTVEVLQRSLKGQKLVCPNEAFDIAEDGSAAHGHVEAVLSAMRRLGFASLVSSRPSRNRDLVVAMVAARILEPQSKLATARWWPTTTLSDVLGLGDVGEDELYEAMDWLLENQSHIEKKLAARHLQSDGLALYDLTSSYFEGITCPLAAMGYSRDQKKGKLQVNYGLLTNDRGIPVAVSVFKGNSGDPTTLLPQVNKLRDEFDIKRFVLVGDRGMITQKQVNELRETDGAEWISALRPGAINKLIQDGSIQMGLFDKRNLFELDHPDFPRERLVPCRNPELARRRAAKRKALLEATVEELDKVRRMVSDRHLHGNVAIAAAVDKVLEKSKFAKHYEVQVREDGFDCTLNEKSLATELSEQVNGNADLVSKRLAGYQRHIKSVAKQIDILHQRTKQGRLYGKAKIGVRVGRVINKYKVAKHFVVTIEDDSFEFRIDQEQVDSEAALDGLYVVRTSVSKATMDASQAVRSYKLLSNVERAFRCLKSVDLMVRPIHHHLEDRVRAHIFLCMLAYYVQWHMAEAWRPLLFADEDQEAKKSRDPVAPAKRSASALEKVHTKKLGDNSLVHSFHTLLDHLKGIVRNTCRCRGAPPDSPTFTTTTTPNPTQRRALKLLETIDV